LTTTGTAAKGNKIAYAVIGAFVALCAVGWAIIVAYGEGTPGITPEVISWQVTDRSASVHYTVSKPKDENVRCAIIAYDVRHAELAHVEITLPAGTGDVDRRQTVPTSARATSVTVNECRSG
jgi:Domain of unknown function (DUF4307)